MATWRQRGASPRGGGGGGGGGGEGARGRRARRRGAHGAGRATTEGKVGYRLADDGSKGTMVAVGCETEPVSNNEEFLAFAKKVLEVVDEQGAGAAGELVEERAALAGQ